VRSLYLLFFLIFSSVGLTDAAPNSAVHGPDSFKGEFTLTIPADRLLDSVELKVSVEKSRDIIETENQKAEDPTDVVFVGHRRDAKIRKDRRGRVRLQKGSKKEGSLLIYVLSPIYEIKTFTITPRFYTRDDIFFDKGVTDPVFALDILESEKFGDLEGEVVQTMEGLSFRIGEENVLEIHHRLGEGKKVAFRLRGSTKEMAYLHLPVNKLGSYPAFYVENGLRSRKVFNAPVSINFIMPPDTMNLQKQIPMRFLTRDVNRFLQSHPSHGLKGIIEVPVRLEMRLAPKKRFQKRRLNTNLFQSESVASEKNESDSPFFNF
jgi:hypothetical protein